MDIQAVFQTTRDKSDFIFKVGVFTGISPGYALLNFTQCLVRGLLESHVPVKLLPFSDRFVYGMGNIFNSVPCPTLMFSWLGTA